eukprot:5377235-Alexandrium_andersonii.AAC.1
MSASLVGSEMCIRDSLLNCNDDASQKLAGLSLVLGDVLRDNQGCPEEPVAAAASTCLLYTSDAADDM